jgi:hypothetical protein
MRRILSVVSGCQELFFFKIHDAIMGQDPFILKEDVTGKKGIHLLVKLVGCLRYLAYGDAFDREDENLGMSESALQEFCKVFAPMIVKEFRPTYLNRTPSIEQRRAISEKMVAKGFPGCLAS